MRIMAANGPSPETQTGEPQSLPYYFPDLRSLTQVVELLSYHIEVNGAFILRNSSSGINYTLTVVHNGGVKHIKIQGDKTGGYRLAKRSFESLSDLISYYGTHDVPNVEAVNSVRLTHPVSRDYINSTETSLPSPTVPTAPTPRPRQFTRVNYIETCAEDHGAQSSSADSNNGSQIITIRPPRPQRATEPETPKVPASPTNPKSGPNGASDGRQRAVRPPPPPPVAPQPTTAPPSPHVNHHQSQYDYAANISHNHTDDLILMLRLTERCECGLYIQEATLPQGWTLHLTENAERKVFFVSPEQQSSWSLPPEIIAILQPSHKAVLKKYDAL